MKFISSLSLALSLASLSLLSVSAVDFQTDVEPILNEKCFKCHSGPRHKGNLRMDTPDNFAKRVGGENPVIVPGDPESSLLAIKAGLPRSDGSSRCSTDAKNASMSACRMERSEAMLQILNEPLA